MRHRKAFNHLGRKSAHRQAMLANMASSLIMHKRITTTTAKAKALRTYIEPLITRSKEDTTHSRRVVFTYLKNKYAVAELFREVSPKVADRPGGYTRILKLGNRPGDNADMSLIELVDFNEVMLEAAAQESKAKTTRRSRRGRKKSEPDTTEKVSSGTSASEASSVVEEVSETPAVETKELPEDKEVAAEEKTKKAETKVEEPEATEQKKTKETKRVDKEEAEEKTSSGKEDLPEIKEEAKKEKASDVTPEKNPEKEEEKKGEEGKEETK